VFSGSGGACGITACPPLIPVGRFEAMIRALHRGLRRGLPENVPAGVNRKPGNTNNIATQQGPTGFVGQDKAGCVFSPRRQECRCDGFMSFRDVEASNTCQQVLQQ
jgi:hypothetical protein